MSTDRISLAELVGSIVVLATQQDDPDLREAIRGFDISFPLGAPVATEIARLTERCDAYREALRDIADGNNLPDDLLAHGREHFREHFGAALQHKARAALASPAGEQKDKTT